MELLSGYGSDDSDEKITNKPKGLVGYSLGSDSSEASDDPEEAIHKVEVVKEVEEVIDNEEIERLAEIKRRRTRIDSLLPPSRGIIKGELQHKVEMDHAESR